MSSQRFRFPWGLASLASMLFVGCALIIITKGSWLACGLFVFHYWFIGFAASRHWAQLEEDAGAWKDLEPPGGGRS